MDWEEKVSSLLRDTEANLSRVKVKFQPKSSQWNYSKLSNTVPLRRYSSLSELTPRDHHTSNLAGGQFRASGLSDNLSTIHPSQHPSLSSSTLQDKLDQQNKLIDQLMQMVHKLDSERNNYNEQIRDIRGTLQQLGNNRETGRAPDSGVERRVEQVRRELQAEIHSLHTQIQLYKSSSTGDSNPGQHFNHLSRDLQDVKQSLRDEMEGIKRDIDILRNRVLRLEMDAPAASFHRSPDRSTARIEAALKEVTAKSPSYPSLSAKRAPLLSSQTPSNWPYQTAKDVENGQLCDIRKTLTSLESKVNSMESSLHNRSRLLRSSAPANGHSPYKYSPSYQTHGHVASIPNGVQGLTSTTKSDTFNGFYHPDQESELRMEDLNLSDDDESTSLDTFGAESVKVINTKKIATNGHIDLDDDLDLDDLDLSDDTISLTSEQLDSAEF